MTTKELKKEKKRKEELTKIIKIEIERYVIWTGHTKAELATKLGMSQASLYNKVKNVDNFTYKDIRRLCNVLKLNDETKLALIA
jgi:DNA-binding Xre family transcriptional regulator